MTVVAFGESGLMGSFKWRRDFWPRIATTENKRAKKEKTVLLSTL